MPHFRTASTFAFLFAALTLAGCGGKTDPVIGPQGSGPGPNAKTGNGGEIPPPREVDEVTAERTKLSPADRALVEAQEWCVVSNDERLGSMGAPIKLDIKGEAVFVCCKGCKKKAESDPDATLAKVKELKAKAKAQRDAKG